MGTVNSYSRKLVSEDFSLESCMEMLSFEYAQISELSNRTKGETPHHSRERTDKETPDEEALLRKVWARA